MSRFDNPSGASVGPTRMFVPFILNDRIWRYTFAPVKAGKCAESICVEIPMKYYEKGEKDWVVRQIFCTFVKKERTIGDICGPPKNAEKAFTCYAFGKKDPVKEVYYICNSNKMYYDDDYCPVANGGP